MLKFEVKFTWQLSLEHTPTLLHHKYCWKVTVKLSSNSSNSQSKSFVKVACCLHLTFVHSLLQLKQSGSLCRKSAHDCDLEEYCTGESAFCPTDDYKMNGLPCNFNQGYCYNGQCPTHREHCKLLWGTGRCFRLLKKHSIALCAVKYFSLELFNIF